MGTDASGRRYLPLIAGVLWGTSFPAIEVALAGFTPLQIALVRAVVSAAVLGGLLLAWDATSLAVTRGQIPPLALMGLFGVGGFYLSQVFAVRFSTAINVSFVVMTYPVFTSALAPFVLEEELRRRDVVGLAFSLLGTYVIVGNGRLIPIFDSATFLGDLIAVGGSLCMTVYLLANGRFADRFDLDPFAITFYMVAFAIPVLFAPLAYLGQFGVGTVSPVAGGALAWLALVVTAGGYLTLNLGLSVETTTLSALRLLIIPLVATLLSVALLGEPLTPVKVAGGAAILVGISYPTVALYVHGPRDAAA